MLSLTESQHELFVKHIPLVDWVLKDMRRNEWRQEYLDVKQMGLMKLAELCQRHDDDRATFMTFAVFCLRRFFFRKIYNNKKRVARQNAAVELCGHSRGESHDGNIFTPYENDSLRDAIESLRKQDELAHLVLHYRTIGYTLEFIGHRIGKSKERVRQIEVRAIRSLRRIMGRSEPGKELQLCA